MYLKHNNEYVKYSMQLSKHNHNNMVYEKTIDLTRNYLISLDW